MISYQGIEYVRVSNILKKFHNFSFVKEDILKNKAEIGVGVHCAINDFILGKSPNPRQVEMGYFNSFLQWKNGLVPQFMQSEERYFDEEKKITGQIDALIKIEGHSSNTLVDFKTSSHESPEVWEMQANFYFYLLKKNGIDVSSNILFIKLDKRGSIPKIFYYKYQPSVLKKCLVEVDLFWNKLELVRQI